MVKTVIVQGKKIKVPVIVAREGPFLLVRRLTKVPKPLGIEFVVKRETRFGRVLVSSQLAGKTKADGMKLLKAAIQSEKLLRASIEAAKKAGAIAGKGLIRAGRIGFRLAERASKPRKRTRRKKRKN